MNPKVSIIIPCYNHAQFLGEALQSVVDQSYNNWECLIVNDGSTDNTEIVSREWVKKDRRINYFYKNNSGVSNTRNFGIRKSKGEFILPLDADDRISKNYLEICLTAIENSNFKIVYGKVVFFGEQNKGISFGEPSLQNLLIKNRIHCSGLFRKEDWKANNGYDEKMEHGFEDWEFWINILRRGGNAKLMNQCTLFYRIKEISRSTKINSDSEYRREMVNHIFQKHLDLYGYSSSFDIYEDKLKLEEQFKNLHMVMSYKQILRIFLRKAHRRIMGK